MKNKSNALTFLEKHNKGPLTFGQALTAIRETEEISQSQLARDLSVSRGIICDIEKGRRMVTVPLAIKIAKYLEYPPESFLVLLFKDQLRKEKLDNKFIIEIKVA
ncbi:MAG: helix-turn-helix transcriptional regulator [Oligoflexia bacterium]|nr:helix-turn-helix transcriptional regulator [Oligoflexia bacterium]